jgi:hypothetical protein
VHGGVQQALREASVRLEYEHTLWPELVQSTADGLGQVAQGNTVCVEPLQSAHIRGNGCSCELHRFERVDPGGFERLFVAIPVDRNGAIGEDGNEKHRHQPRQPVSKTSVSYRTEDGNPWIGSGQLTSMHFGVGILPFGAADVDRTLVFWPWRGGGAGFVARHRNCFVHLFTARPTARPRPRRATTTGADLVPFLIFSSSLRPPTRKIMSDPTWEEAWPEAEDALKQAAREHAAMLSREREKAMTASRKARASEKALRALPAALQRAQTAEAALRELQELHNPPTGSTSKPPPPPLEPAAISEEAAAAATAAAVETAIEATETEARAREEALNAEAKALDEQCETLAADRIKLKAELEAQSVLLAASQREVEELRAALAAEREKAEAAATDAALQRAAAQEAADRASSSEESLQAAASREAAARRLLAQQVSQQLKSLGKIATHLAPTSAVS